MFEKKRETNWNIRNCRVDRCYNASLARQLRGKKTLGKKQEKKKEKKENNRVKRANENKDKIESNSMTDVWRRIRE